MGAFDDLIPPKSKPADGGISPRLFDAFQETLATPAPAAAAPAGGISITSPMPGLVFKILVSVGQKVTKDEQLIILEAMKMESPIYAPNAATVSAILVKEGDAVSEGQVLIQLS